MPSGSPVTAAEPISETFTSSMRRTKTKAWKTGCSPRRLSGSGCQKSRGCWGRPCRTIGRTTMQRPTSSDAWASSSSRRPHVGGVVSLLADVRPRSVLSLTPWCLDWSDACRLDSGNRLLT
jgi:hypothetical protein